MRGILSGLVTLIASSCLSGCIVRQEGQAAATGGQPTPAQGAARGEDLPSTMVFSGMRGFQLGGETAKVDLSFVPVAGQPFTEALRAEIKEGSDSEWAVQVQAPLAEPVKAGDVLFATFHVRAAQLQEWGTAQTQFVFELAGEPWTKSVTYPLGVDEGWRKVHVRFKSAADYAPGGAQLIFRLGYQPQTLEIGGLTLQNFGEQLEPSQLPGTEIADRVKPRVVKPVEIVDGGPLSFEVQPHQVLTAISPYVYGINSQQPADVHPSVRRMGGNRQTAYNWELNASNAGRDYKHQNDDWPCTNLGYQDCDVPAAQFTNFVRTNRAIGAESVVTVPLVDFVSADKRGPVSEAEAAPSKRFLRSHIRKQRPFTLQPDSSDDAVYQDEFVNFLVQQLGSAAKGGPRFYSLDNEPALWPSTHPRVHPWQATYKEVLERSEAMAWAITKIDPSAEVLGGVMFAYGEFLSLSNAPDAEQFNARYGTYTEFLLASMAERESRYGRRLMHVLDVHWYPEPRGTVRITEDDTHPLTIEARLAAPRSLWDPSYREKSWITGNLGGPIRLLPWLHELIDKRYPGTKLSMTEYNYGAGEHISGGLAQADVLGILGRERVYVANYWGNGPGVGPLPRYIAAAFKLYRNYDGRQGRYGDTAIAASTSDLERATIYAATESRKPGRLTILVLNKDQRENHPSTIRGLELAGCSSVQGYRLGSSSPDIKPLGNLPVTSGSVAMKLPALSATLLVCDPGVPLPAGQP